MRCICTAATLTLINLFFKFRLQHESLEATRDSENDALPSNQNVKHHKNPRLNTILFGEYIQVLSLSGVNMISFKLINLKEEVK